MIKELITAKVGESWRKLKAAFQKETPGSWIDINIILDVRNKCKLASSRV